MPAWIVGDTFLKTVFSVFDAGKNRIGFASLPKGGAQTKSITSATMDNSVASSYQQTASSEGSPFGGGGGGVAHKHPPHIKTLRARATFGTKLLTQR